MRIALALGLLAVVACGHERRVGSCRDSLAGVWLDPASGRRYHMVANPRGYEMYAMWNSAVPPAGADTTADTVWAPLVFDFSPRPGGGLGGTRSQRAERAGQPCNLRTQAAITSCAGGVLVIELEQPTAIDWDHCRAARTAARTLRLRAE